MSVSDLQLLLSQIGGEGSIGGNLGYLGNIGGNRGFGNGGHANQKVVDGLLQRVRKKSYSNNFII